MSLKPHNEINNSGFITGFYPTQLLKIVLRRKKKSVTYKYTYTYDNIVYTNGKANKQRYNINNTTRYVIARM